MFENPTDLKEFLSWAKNQKIQSLKVGDVEIVFHPLALVDGATFDENEANEALSTALGMTTEDEDDLLFHSSE